MSLFVPLCDISDVTPYQDYKNSNDFTHCTYIHVCNGNSLIEGIRWKKHLLISGLDPEFFVHIDAVFGVVLVCYLVGFMLTVCSVRETPLAELSQPAYW